MGNSSNFLVLCHCLNDKMAKEELSGRRPEPTYDPCYIATQWHRIVSAGLDELKDRKPHI